MIDQILPMPEILISDLMRFWSKVDRKRKNECWNWIGCKNKNENGYGLLSINNKMYRTHRLSYFIHYNEDPRESLICHICNNPPCVNPNHLFLGDYSKNIKQAYMDNRRSSKGILNTHSKLQESDIKEIKRMQGTISGYEVAGIFCVIPSTIYKIWRGELWSHIQ